MADEAVLELEDDYYGILSVPRGIGYVGLQAAYARMADDLANRMNLDPTARDELLRINRAFAVLGNSELRKKYDACYFAGDVAVTERGIVRDVRRTRLASNVLFGTLVTIVIVQAAVVGYIERAHLDEVVSVVLGPLMPGRAK
jgi:hypothetical protein